MISLAQPAGSDAKTILNKHFTASFSKKNDKKGEYIVSLFPNVLNK